ncbi:polyprenyl synthetase family protein [Streptomyces acidiscabies]|uniref:polyprenyl synthetase family protein n=1 Tax=Streptomyces acidiscabies TaxID=42234 RepID=UPI00067B616F|nr:polyprenyl synthetase family protein [Streptomyces acidiscabies]
MERTGTGALGTTAEAGADGTRAMKATLERCRGLVRPALRSAADRLGPELQQVVFYHMGWTDSAGRPSEGDSGKGLRGCLALLSAEVSGGEADAGLPGAVAMELVHNFSLLHDDVIDLDRERRHRQTAWTVFGIGPAIVAGDALLTLALQVVLESGAPGAAEAAAVLLDATGEMIDGQAKDLSYQVRRNLTVEDVLGMFAGKTGALFGAAASLGAILAGADAATVTALRRYGTNLGIAFQAVDDLLGTFGDPRLTGKDVGADVQRRKLTLPLATALSGEGAGVAELRAVMETDGELDARLVDRATRLIEECGGRELTRRHARDHHNAAIEALESIRATASPEAWQSLYRIAVFSVERSH